MNTVIYRRWSLFTLLPIIAYLAQEGAAGAAEPVQAEQRTHSPASRADPAAPGPQHGYTEGTKEPGGCSHGWKYILPKSTLLVCCKDVKLRSWT